MADVKMFERGIVAEVVQRYGRCLELIPVDPGFHNISVALHGKDGIATVWTYSRKPGVEDRIRMIRDQMVVQGGMAPVDGTHNQVRSPCGQLHIRCLKLLVTQVVERGSDSLPSEGRFTVKDLRSPLLLGIESGESDGRWVYRVTGEGEARNKAARLRAITAGFIQYGDMEEGDEGVSFPCGRRHDELARLVLPYARNVTGVEDSLGASEVRGQMTTGTIGFSQR